jgi:tetratricopeptide (TPR) repeat protein
MHRNTLKSFLFLILFTTLAYAGESELVRQARSMLAANPNDVGTMVKAGQILYREGLHAEAVTLWQDVMKLKPAMADPHFFVGKAHFDSTHTEDAIVEFKKAIELKSDYAEAHYHLGIAYAELGDTDNAILEYKETVRINPSFPEVNDDLGRALLNKGRTDEAVLAYKEAIRIQPDNAGAHFGLGTALKAQGRYDEAVNSFYDFIRHTPTKDNEEELERANQMIDQARKQKEKAKLIED